MSTFNFKLGNGPGEYPTLGHAIAANRAKVADMLGMDPSTSLWGDQGLVSIYMKKVGMGPLYCNEDRCAGDLAARRMQEGEYSSLFDSSKGEGALRFKNSDEFKTLYSSQQTPTVTPSASGAVTLLAESPPTVPGTPIPSTQPASPPGGGTRVTSAEPGRPDTTDRPTPATQTASPPGGGTGVTSAEPGRPDTTDRPTLVSPSAAPITPDQRLSDLLADLPVTSREKRKLGSINHTVERDQAGGVVRTITTTTSTGSTVILENSDNDPGTGLDFLDKEVVVPGVDREITKDAEGRIKIKDHTAEGYEETVIETDGTEQRYTTKIVPLVRGGTAERTYDSNDRLTKEVITHSDGTRTTRAFTYDPESGNLIKEVAAEPDGTVSEYKDTDGDGSWDEKVVKTPDETVLKYKDNNGDGDWNEVIVTKQDGSSEVHKRINGEWVLQDTQGATPVPAALEEKNPFATVNADAPNAASAPAPPDPAPADTATPAPAPAPASPAPEAAASPPGGDVRRTETVPNNLFGGDTRKTYVGERLIEEVLENSRGEIERENKYTYNPENGNLIKEVKTNLRSGLTEENTYDPESGKLIQHVIADSDGKIIYSRNYTYDSNDRPITEVITDSRSKETIKNTYDPEIGKLIKSVVTYPDKTIISTYDYDKGMLKEVVTDSKGTRMHKYIDGRFIEYVAIGPDGKITETRNYTYDPNGEPSEKVVTDSKGIRTYKYIDGSWVLQDTQGATPVPAELE